MTESKQIFPSIKTNWSTQFNCFLVFVSCISQLVAAVSNGFSSAFIVKKKKKSNWGESRSGTRWKKARWKKTKARRYGLSPLKGPPPLRGEAKKASPCCSTELCSPAAFLCAQQMSPTDDIRRSEISVGLCWGERRKTRRCLNIVCVILGVCILNQARGCGRKQQRRYLSWLTVWFICEMNSAFSWELVLIQAVSCSKSIN